MSEQALLVDYGGVLTGSVAHALRDVERTFELARGELFEVLLSGYGEDGDGLIHRLERGQMSGSDFEDALIGQMQARGHSLDRGVFIRGIHRVFNADPASDMWSIIARARAAGIRTVLVSNSWGTDGYPLDQLNAHFDSLVISGEVGLRKPDRAIYLLACDRAGVEPSGCAFVDDFPGNIDTAVALGMHGVLHTGDVAATADSLSGFFGVELS